MFGCLEAGSPVDSTLGSSNFASGIASSLIVAAIKAIVSRYVAVDLAKTYEEISCVRSF